MTDTHQKTILIIDDEPAIRESFSYYLEDRGYSIVTAENGRKGLSLFEENGCDLVMVDLRMPEISGLEVLTRINRDNPEIPIIVISGTGVIADAVDALRQGAWDYLQKPVNDLAILDHTIGHVLEKAEMKRQLLQYQHNLEDMVSRRTKELKKLLQEKEVLIQEIHHRVKNNMTVIISLLSLKSETLYSTEAKAVLEDTENRIRSMVVAHEKLYSSDNLKYISVCDYLSDLVSELAIGYKSSEKTVELNCDFDDLLMDLNLLIPLGLITNEIVTNSIKHAFTTVSHPTITVSLKKRGTNDAELVIADNGPGYTNENIKKNKKTIGIHIIEALSEQINGTVTLDTSRGTSYSILFPIPPVDD